MKIVNDKELLGLAAKAASIDLCDGKNAQWNPLQDDVDAFKLAVMLGITITPYPIYASVKHSVIVKQHRLPSLHRESNPTEVIVVYDDDPIAATRRAIVTCAALIYNAS